MIKKEQRNLKLVIFETILNRAAQNAGGGSLELLEGTRGDGHPREYVFVVKYGKGVARGSIPKASVDLTLDPIAVQANMFAAAFEAAVNMHFAGMVVTEVATWLEVIGHKDLSDRVRSGAFAEEMEAVRAAAERQPDLEGDATAEPAVAGVLADGAPTDQVDVKPEHDLEVPA